MVHLAADHFGDHRVGGTSATGRVEMWLPSADHGDPSAISKISSSRLGDVRRRRRPRRARADATARELLGLRGRESPAVASSYVRTRTSWLQGAGDLHRPACSARRKLARQPVFEARGSCRWRGQPAAGRRRSGGALEFRPSSVLEDEDVSATSRSGNTIRFLIHGGSPPRSRGICGPLSVYGCSVRSPHGRVGRWMRSMVLIYGRLTGAVLGPRSAWTSPGEEVERHGVSARVAPKRFW